MGGVPVVQWNDLRSSDLNLSVALFLLVRADNFSFYGASRGWGEGSWSWHPEYDQLGHVGQPLERAFAAAASGDWQREYEHATVKVHCATSHSDHSHGSVSYHARSHTRDDDERS